MQIYKKATKQVQGFFKSFSTTVQELNRPSMESYVSDLAYEAKRNLVINHLKFLRQKADLDYAREAAQFLDNVSNGAQYEITPASSAVNKPVIIKPKSEPKQSNT